ncbi:hypothetical protein CPJCM30710_29110 [Clostridium polyendosporum]|uniref:Membrane protein involved in the export of O-antigen and teichoic acid n=1 Tax=Clostridium polyendosporum TaxID=69208 RepID=A0A919S0Z4_9CLOT|nr:oligosaccharide flippase family protein [Clostridium polyendosporum]GIM30245.1 hypothetical protein CPJCM30710_29110 [Clostridium polyendosporum]
MQKKSKLVNNFIIYAIGNLGSKLLVFLLLPLYSYYLTQSEFGSYDIIMTLIGFIAPIVSCQINQGLYRYILDTNDEKEKSRIITNSYFIVIKNLIIFILLVLLIQLFYKFQFVYLVLFQVIFMCTQDITLQVARGLEKNKEYSYAGMLNTLVNLISNIILIVFLGLKVEALLISIILSSVVSILYIAKTIDLFQYINFSMVNGKIRNELLKFSLPLIPNALSWWVTNLSDRYLLLYYKGIESTGIYAIANKLPSILITINTIFYLAWQDTVISEHDSNKKDYSKMFSLLMVLQCTAAIGLISINKYLMKFLVSPDFYEAWKYTPFLYVGVVFSVFSSFYGVFYLSVKNTKGNFYTSVIGALINIVLNVVLIPVIGIQGASLSTMISYIVIFIMRAVHTKEFVNVDIDTKKFLLLNFLMGIYIYLSYIENFILSVILIVGGVLVFGYLNLEFIKKFGSYFGKRKLKSKAIN